MVSAVGGHSCRACTDNSIGSKYFQYERSSPSHAGFNRRFHYVSQAFVGAISAISSLLISLGRVGPRLPFAGPSSWFLLLPIRRFETDAEEATILRRIRQAVG